MEIKRNMVTNYSADMAITLDSIKKMIKTWVAKLGRKVWPSDRTV